MCGADPLFLSLAMIIEEGFPIADLEKIVDSIKQAADKAEISIVTGDTKVVPSGAADRLFINTSGIGKIPKDVDISGANARPGDRILLSGTLADHGIAVLTQREGFQFNSSIKSDTAPLNHMVRKMCSVSQKIRVLRDPTRGGLGTTLNEIAASSKVGIKIYEEKIPIHEEVAGICELLGFDPLYLANEGKLVAMVAPDHYERIFTEMKKDPYGESASVIGEVVADHPGRVVMETRIGGSRIIDMLTGEQLPRIC
jgi:hydrogenase expression/formation protein HypE